ncbi:regulator of nonsense transcripts 3A isoform X2 [Belonocnema kinseyi]|uniref:regulator of nonsense transcripts 3A isoform X2 n=1 Tax=Belonocnema kinseyi TaxID=2817044 RepID=UPI00143D998D|nr:regulator of nonsense transcripts 3A isoform X2 [Belonocnema kinseyi]
MVGKVIITLAYIYFQISMTEQTQQSETAQSDSCNTSVAGTSKLRDSKKEKCRPMTKVIIRRLPPSMTQEQFMEQISPLPDYDHLYLVKADMSLGQNGFSRAYINFVNQQDIFIFREKFDNYVFVDAKGTEYPAVVEFAPFQRLPKKRMGKKKDLKCGTIETDLYYISFVESLKTQENETGNNQPKTEYSYQPTDDTPKKISTPLLDYLKQRKHEKQRLREEKREERRRRDFDRRRANELNVPKVLKNTEFAKEASKDKKYDKEKNVLKDLKLRNKKEDKFRDKPSKERDGKLSTKSYRDREEKTKDRDIKHHNKNEDKKFYAKKDERESFKDRMEERRSDSREERKFETKEDQNEFMDRKLVEKRGKSYEKMRQEKKRLSETKRQSIAGHVADCISEKTKKEDSSKQHKMSDENEMNDVQKDKEHNGVRCTVDKNYDYVKISMKKEKEEEKLKTIPDEVIIPQKFDTVYELPKENSLTGGAKSKSSEYLNKEFDYCEIKKLKKQAKVVKRRNSLESGGESGGGDGACLRRHKSLDGADHSNLQKHEKDEKDKDKKDPRLERRIKNKVANGKNYRQLIPIFGLISRGLANRFPKFDTAVD